MPICEWRRAATVRTALCLFLAVCVVGVWGARGEPPGSAKLDAGLRGLSAGSARVIIKTRGGQVDVVADRLRGRGRSVLKRHTIIEAVTAEVQAEDLALLAADPAVSSISLDAAVAASAASGPATGPGTLLATLGLPREGLTGKGVGIAIVDSGLEPNGDFSNVLSYDFTADGSGGVGGPPTDDYGHGTHVAGLIGSKGSLSQGAFVGLAPRARIVSLKVLDALGYGSTSSVIDALEFATVNRQALGINVINLSLGHPILEHAATDPLVQAVEAASRVGIVVVVAAGNVGRHIETGVPGYGGILSPANAPSAITVGALDTKNTTSRSDDTVAGYSSRGPTWYDALPKPDLLAPGHGLVSDAATGSTLYTRFPDRHVAGNGGPARFLRLNGTSMSAAVTTGAVALLIEASRAAGSEPSPATIKAILEFTAVPVHRADPLTQGHGSLNVAGAVALIEAWAAASSPSTPYEALPISPVTTIVGETWVWAQDFSWNDTVVWGNADNDGEPFWADTVVWGNVDWADTVIWGNASALTWTDSVIWGNTVVWGNADDTW